MTSSFTGHKPVGDVSTISQWIKCCNCKLFSQSQRKGSACGRIFQIAIHCCWLEVQTCNFLAVASIYCFDFMSEARIHLTSHHQNVEFWNCYNHSSPRLVFSPCNCSDISSSCFSALSGRMAYYRQVATSIVISHRTKEHFHCEPTFIRGN